MKAEEVYKRVKSHFINHEHNMLNKYIFRKDWESDYFCVSKSGYCIEVEVKVSRADFRADFEKPKHKIIEAIIRKENFYIERLGESTWYPNSEQIRIHDLMVKPFPNKFWYAMPEGLVNEKEIPAYAGLMVISEDGYGIAKDAPFIHKRKLHLPDLLFDKYRWGYQNQSSEIERLKHEVWRLNECVKNLTLQVAT